MNSSDISLAVDSLQADIIQLVDKLPNLKHKKWISRSLSSLVRMAGEEFETLDWKIISASLLDLERGFQIFYPYRHVRKICIFGSARISADTQEYRMAADFAKYVTQQGFMVLTGVEVGLCRREMKGRVWIYRLG